MNEMFDGLRQLLDGISLVQEASPRVKARVMAHGELLSTLLGVSILKVVLRLCLNLFPADFPIETWLECN